MNLFTRQKQSSGYQWGNGGRDKLAIGDYKRHTTV